MAAVRMGEMVVSTNADDELVALGLGSCIGLAIVDRSAGIAGLAHIVLPESGDRFDQPGKFANTAVPELIARVRGAGGVTRRFETCVAGGARMFEMTGGLDIGARNEAAVRAALDQAGVGVRAAETGGNQGRTVKVAVGQGLVTVRVAGQSAVTLLAGRGRRGDDLASGRGPTIARSTTASSATGALREPRAAMRIGAWL